MSEEEHREEVEEQEEVAPVEETGGQEYPVGGEETEAEVLELSVGEIEGIVTISDIWDSMIEGKLTPNEARKELDKLYRKLYGKLRSRRRKKQETVEEEEEEEEAVKKEAEKEEEEKKLAKKKSKSSKAKKKKKSEEGEQE